MSTTPFTQGQICAPAARKKLSFLDGFLTLWIFSQWRLVLLSGTSCHLLQRL